MRAAAILLAAGRGKRFGGAEPKAFTELGGETLLTRAVRVVEACPDVGVVVLVAPPGEEERARALAAGATKLVAVVAGGPSRQASARRGLEALPGEVDTVVCHDVARPLASSDLYVEVLTALDRADGAVPVVGVADTIKRVHDGEVLETLPRDGLALVQTPQAFRRAALETAHRRAEEEGFTGTDDAVLLERAGFRVVAVPGDPRNLKITDRGDQEVAAVLLAGG